MVPESQISKVESDKRISSSHNLPIHVPMQPSTQNRIVNVAYTNPPRMYEANGGNYQSPSKIIKKEVMAPEEVHSQ